MKNRRLIILLAALAALSAVTLAYFSLYRQQPMTDAQRAALSRIENLGMMTGAPRVNWMLATGNLTETEARKAALRDPAVHILFLGIDRRKDERARSDAIHLLRFERGRLTLISIPRDSLVGIHGQPQKVNAAYAFGGAPMAIRTIEDLVKIHIDAHLELDLPRFAEVASIAKTVTLDGRLIGAESIFRHIDGLLSWLRNRSMPGGDIRRIQRQQLFITRALDWTLTLYQEHPTAFAAIVQPILNLLPTDITYEHVTALCDNYTRQPLIGHPGWTPPPLETRNRAMAEMERYYLPGRSATLDVETREVIDSALAARNLAHAEREKGAAAPAGAPLPAAGESDAERYLSIYIADTRPLLQMLQTWRGRKMRSNYVVQDSLPGEDTAAVMPAAPETPGPQTDGDTAPAVRRRTTAY